MPSLPALSRPQLLAAGYESEPPKSPRDHPKSRGLRGSARLRSQARHQKSRPAPRTRVEPRLSAHGSRFESNTFPRTPPLARHRLLKHEHTTPHKRSVSALDPTYATQALFLQYARPKSYQRVEGGPFWRPSNQPHTSAH